MKIIWTLRYDSSVTTYLRSIRGTEKCGKIHEAIKELQYKKDPTEGCRNVPERPERYEFEIEGHWIGIRVLTDDKSVRILYITIN